MFNKGIMNTFILQLKGDQSFPLFSQVTDAESLSQTWRLCTKISAHLEQGERLENLSWRLFYLHSVIASEGNTGDTRTFKRLSKETGQRLDREKHLQLSQLTAPRLRTGLPSNTQSPTVSTTLHHPTVVCSTNSFITCGTFTASSPLSAAHMSPYNLDFQAGSFNLESFLSSFSPLALLGAVDCYSDTRGELVTMTPQDSARTSDLCTMASEDVGTYPDFSDATLSSVYAPSRPMTITTEIRNHNQDILLSSPIAWANSSLRSSSSDWSTSSTIGFSPMHPSPCSSMNSAMNSKCVSSMSRLPSLAEELHLRPTTSALDDCFVGSDMLLPLSPLSSQSDSPHYQNLGRPETPALYSPFKRTPEAPSHKLNERKKRRNPMATRPPTFTGLSELTKSVGSDGSNENPICSNCLGTRTPLWRRGPDDELLCNACGVFYKVHKRHRPDTLKKIKNVAGNGEVVSEPGNGVPIECVNCNAVATPMWRKAPDGRLLCNACALYLKCHKRPRPTHSNRLSNSPAAQDPASRHVQLSAIALPHTKLTTHISQRTSVRAGPCYQSSGVEKSSYLNKTNVSMALDTCGQLNQFPFA